MSEQLKRQAAEDAVNRFVRGGMRIGLGTGSTAIWAVRRIGEMLQRGELRDLLAIATSRATHDEALGLGIPLMPGSLPHDLDLTIDGADEIDADLNLIKGGGGALLREKIVAQNSARVVIVADESKLSPRLGTRARLPVEVTRFGWSASERFLQSLGGGEVGGEGGGRNVKTRVRCDELDEPLITDEGHYIIDCDLGPIADAHALAQRLEARAGIVEHGLFLNLATDAIIAGTKGIEHRTRERK